MSLDQRLDGRRARQERSRKPYPLLQSTRARRARSREPHPFEPAPSGRGKKKQTESIDTRSIEVGNGVESAALTPDVFRKTPSDHTLDHLADLGRREAEADGVCTQHGA